MRIGYQRNRQARLFPFKLKAPIGMQFVGYRQRSDTPDCEPKIMFATIVLADAAQLLKHAINSFQTPRLFIIICCLWCFTSMHGMMKAIF